MRRLFAALCAAVLCFLLLSRGAAAAEEPEIPAVSYVLMEAETGTILLESEGEKKVSCGTMAKLMTALLTAEQIEQGCWTTDSPITVTDGVTGTKGAVIC